MDILFGDTDTGGEHGLKGHYSGSCCGSSPRVWGTLPGTAYIIACDRFIPTYGELYSIVCHFLT